MNRSDRHIIQSDCARLRAGRDPRRREHEIEPRENETATNENEIESREHSFEPIEYSFAACENEFEKREYGLRRSKNVQKDKMNEEPQSTRRINAG